MKFGRWYAVLLLVLLVTPCAKEALVDSVVGSTTVYLYAIADAYVNSTDPNVNYGDSTSLILHKDAYESYVYIMFNLSSIPSNAVILSAELRVHLSSVSGFECDIGAHHCADISWKESEITWSNKPDFEPAPTDTVKFRAPSVMTGYKYWDVTAYAPAMLSTGRLTEVLVMNWSGWSTRADFDSSEAKNDRPYLAVEYVTAPIYNVHMESVQDTGETSNVGSIYIVSGGTERLPKDLAIVAGNYNVTYNSGCRFVKWETSGGVKVFNASAQSTTITVFGQGTLRAVGSSRRIEYFYDYSQSSGEGSNRNPGDIAAVRFTPVVTNKLLAARIYFYNCRDDTVRIHVMDAERRDLITPFDQTPKFEKTYITSGWFDVDLSDYNLTVNSGTDFYIGMEWITKGKPVLGAGWVRLQPYDPIDDRSWVWNGTDWTNIAKEDYTIRAIVGVPKASSTITCSVSPLPVEIGSNVTVSGSISPAHPGATVSLTYTWPDNKTDARKVAEKADGSYSDIYTPYKVGAWSVIAKWEGDEEYKEAVSALIPFTVDKVSSSISCSLSSSSITFGLTVQIDGLISPVTPYVYQITIGYSTDHGMTWVNKSALSKSDGTYSYVWKPPTTGMYQIKAVWPGDAIRKQSESPVQTLVVIEPTTSSSSTTQTTKTSTTTPTSTSTSTSASTTTRTTTSTSIQTTQSSSTSAQPINVNLVLYVLPFVEALVVAIVIIAILLVLIKRKR